MTDTFQHEDVPTHGRLRADEIHLHHRGQRRSRGPLIGLAILGLCLLALWALGRGREQAACGEKTVIFSQNSAALTPAGKIALSELATCLKANPAQVVRLEGRADSDEMLDNTALPRDRADALVEELSIQGVPASRVRVTAAPTACTTGEDCRGARATPEVPQR